MKVSEVATQLVNLDDYVDQIIQDFKTSRLRKYYVELSASTVEDFDSLDAPAPERPLDDVVKRVLLQKSRLALLGNFGTGKTSFCKKFAHDLAVMYKSDATVRIPVIVPLSDYETRLDIQELITNTLQFRYGVRIDLTICQELQRLGRFLFLFDGFDEMASRVDRDVVLDNLRELNKVARIKENKFVVTCRTHFFRDNVEASVFDEFETLYIPEWGATELGE